ncbi:MAG: cell division protein FtsZ [Candidatus Aenigmatarchaeota archaeon]
MEVEQKMDSVIQNAFERNFENSEEEKEQESTHNLPRGADSVDHQDVEDEFDIDINQAQIKVVGVGGAGNNTITTLTDMGIDGAETLALNTDASHLGASKADKKMLIGRETTNGLGAGGKPEVGEKSAEESQREIREELKDADMVFITCGLGGGTGTGAAPVVAEMAENEGAIVLAAVTMPFKMEGTRIVKAEEGLKGLREVTDTVIAIENQRLLDYAGDLPVKQAFAVADELISTMIKGISETITQPSLVNLDYADVKTIMKDGGVASIGIGEADSSSRAEEATQKAMNHPLLDMQYEGADGAIIQVIGGEDLKLDEINEIGESISKQLDPQAQVIWGARVVPEYEGSMQVIAIITGVKSPYILGPKEEKQPSKNPEKQENEGVSDELGIRMLNK